MLGWGTAIECNDYIGVSCTSTIAEQYYVNSTIILENTDDTFVDTLGVSSGATHTDMVTADNGKTWAVSKIMIPVIESSSLSSPSSVDANVTVASSTSADVLSAATSTLQLSSPLLFPLQILLFHQPSLLLSLNATVLDLLKQLALLVMARAPLSNLAASVLLVRGSARPSGQFGFGAGSARPSGSFRQGGGKWSRFVGRRA